MKLANSEQLKRFSIKNTARKHYYGQQLLPQPHSLRVIQAAVRQHESRVGNFHLTCEKFQKKPYFLDFEQIRGEHCVELIKIRKRYVVYFFPSSLLFEL